MMSAQRNCQHKELQLGQEHLKPWKPGVSGNPNGRPRKLVPRPDETLHARGISPVEEILKLIAGGELRAPDQLKAWLELLAYCHAKPKEFEVDPGGSPLTALTDEELLRLVRGPQAKIAG